MHKTHRGREVLSQIGGGEARRGKQAKRASKKPSTQASNFLASPSLDLTAVVGGRWPVVSGRVRWASSLTSLAWPGRSSHHTPLIHRCASHLQRHMQCNAVLCCATQRRAGPASHTSPTSSKARKRATEGPGAAKQASAWPSDLTHACRASPPAIHGERAAPFPFKPLARPVPLGFLPGSGTK